MPRSATLCEKIFYRVSRPLVLSYTGAILKMDVQRFDLLPPGPAIIAANHPSTTDPFYVAGMLRRQSFILIKDLLFQVPVLGEYLRRSGHIPVETGRGEEALTTAVERLRAGHTVIIFPEGVLSPVEGGCAQARTGVARLALMSGAPVVPVGIQNAGASLPLVRDGRVRGIGITSLQRSPNAPDLPTFNESGFPGFEATSWFALIGPAGLPKPIVDKVRAESLKVLADPEMKQKFAALGLDTVGSTPEETHAAIAADIPKWAKVIKDANIKPAN